MKSCQKSLVCLLCLMVLSRSASAATSEAAVPSEAPATTTQPSDPKSGDDTGKPYSAIWVRNVFDLKPVPPPVETVVKETNPPPNVKLIGLAEVAKKRQAIFSVTKKPEGGKPGASTDVTYILVEGQRKEDIEVLEIDLGGKRAKIKLDDGIHDLLLETNRPTGGPGPGNIAANGNMRGGENRRSFGNPGGSSGGGPPPPNPNRPLRGNNYPNTGSQVAPQGNNYFQPGAAYQGGYTGATTASATPGLSIPGSAFNQTPTATQNAPEESVPPEVAAAILQVQKAEAAASNRPFPPLPPTLDLSGSENGQAPEPSAPTTTPPPPPLGRKVTGTFPTQ